MEKRASVPKTEHEIIPTCVENVCELQNCRTGVVTSILDRELEKGDMKWLIPAIQAVKGKNPRSLFQSSAVL